MTKIKIGIMVVISIFVLLALLYDNNLRPRNEKTWAERNAGAYSVKIEKTHKPKTLIDEKRALKNSYFGNFNDSRLLEKLDETIEIELAVWQPWVQHVLSRIPYEFHSTLLDGNRNLRVKYDEVWIATHTDLCVLYWNDNEIQAYTMAKLYTADPLTGKALSVQDYKIMSLYDRNYILNKLSK